MKKFLIADLARIIKADPETGTTATSYFTGVSTDSRTTKAGDCFFAIVGENFDGHDYITDAFAKGAVCAVVSRDKSITGGCLFKVDDTIKALGDLAGQYRCRQNFKVVAITGSVGKTTTRQITYHVLSRHFPTFQSPKSFNNNIGLPLTLLAVDNEEIVIAELGSNHPGEIAYLAQIAQPDIAIVTNAYPAHLAGFGDLQTVTQEKLSISQALRQDGVFMINADISCLVDACKAKGIKFTTFGRSDSCDVQAKDIIYGSSSSKFTIDGTEITVPMPGRGNVENVLAAWAICSSFGISIDDFAHDLKSLLQCRTIAMRAQLLQIGTLTVLNDCYNANPASMKNALDILANLDRSQQRRRVFVCGDMAELGEHSRGLHTELGAHIAQANVHLLLVIGKFAKVAADAAKETAQYDLQTKYFQTTLSACNMLEKFIKDDDIILVKGSRIYKLESVVEKLKELFLPV